MSLFRTKPKEAWGVWSPTFREWFNVGSSEPYLVSLREAERALAQARKHYPMADWDVRRYPLDEEGSAEPTPTQPPGRA